MKRLTEWRGEHAAVVNHHENYIDKLAAYEDTGLTPAQIKIILPQQSVEESVKRMKTERARYDEWFAWKQAKEEGRLAVLPCKVGDTVYRVIPKCTGPYINCPYEGGHGLDRCYQCNAFIQEAPFYLSMLDEIGDSVFLTREEAEDALEKQR